MLHKFRAGQPGGWVHPDQQRVRQHRSAGGLPMASLEATEEKLAESVRVAIAESPRFWLGA